MTESETLAFQQIMKIPRWTPGDTRKVTDYIESFRTIATEHNVRMAFDEGYQQIESLDADTAPAFTAWLEQQDPVTTLLLFRAMRPLDKLMPFAHEWGVELFSSFTASYHDVLFAHE